MQLLRLYLPRNISSIQLPLKQSSFYLSSLYLAKNYFINPASSKQLNNICVMCTYVGRIFRGTNSRGRTVWDEQSGTNSPGTKHPLPRAPHFSGVHLPH